MLLPRGCCFLLALCPALGVQNCPRLELLDVSFCRNVDANVVALLRSMTSTASIKMSKGSD